MMETTKHIFDDRTIWRLNGARHREDGPAIEYTDGYKAWCQHGKYHRENGPAIIYPNGDKWWYRHDQYHREDGPAVEWADGDEEWWLFDTELSEEKFWKRVYHDRDDKNCSWI